jgi:hypothetical protein
MQHKHIALAAMALIAGTQAQAVTLISGASASSVAYVEALSTNNVCPSNNVTVYVTGAAGTTALGNTFAVKCNSGTFSATVAGTPIATGENEIRFDVNGGSLNAILYSTGGAGETLAGNPKSLKSTGCAAGVNVTTGVLSSFLGTGNKFSTCGSGVYETSPGKSVGGFMDVEPAIFQAQGVINGTYSAVPATFSQAFAVGVSTALYDALQAYQMTAAGGNLVPATTLVGATNTACTDASVKYTAACQPTVNKAQINAIINADNFNSAKSLGAKYLVPASYTNNAGTQTTHTQTNLSYCRRPATSGTQMGAEVYFLQAVLGTGSLGGTGFIHEPSYITGSAPANVPTVANGGFVQVSNLSVVLNSGTGDLKKCLNKQNIGSQTSTTPGTFAIGMLSAENNPVGSSDTYRLVKVNGASTTAGVAGDSQTANALKGAYDYVFESVVYDDGDAVGTNVLALINGAVRSGSGTPGVFLNSNSYDAAGNSTAESTCTRAGNSVNAYICN